MNNGWFKFYRQTIDNLIWRNDPTAWRVFEVLLCLVDSKTGVWEGGRFQLARIANLNPNTVKSAIDRLIKANMVTTTSTNRFSRVSILKWADFQQPSSPSITTSVTSQSPASHQPVTTLTRSRNTEVEISGIYIPDVVGEEWTEYDDCFGVYKFARRDHYGYVVLSKNNPPRRGKKDMLARHLWVYKNVHGEVPEGYEVNHINRVRGDDDPNNLEALSKPAHVKKHWEEEKAGLVPSNRLDVDKRNPEVQQVIDHFEAKMELKLARPQKQRFAAKTLISRYGLDVVLRGIDAANACKDMQFAPKIVSLENLRDKWNDLVDFYRRQKNTNNNSKVVKL